MKIRFLGTGAAEGWPGMYCNCENCKRARTAGGKNIRTRSQTLINQNLLIDYPADTYMHVVQNNLDLSAVRYCLITHSHLDHFVPGEMVYHNTWAFAHGMTERKMDVYGNERVSELWKNFRNSYPYENPNMKITFHTVRAFETFQMGQYEVTPLPAVHAPQEQAFVYLIREGVHTLLYFLDTAYPQEKVLKWLCDKQIKADMIVYDCTMGISPVCATHMNLEDNIRLHRCFLENGIASERTVAVINHFSHNGKLIYDEMVSEAAKSGLITAWDGMQTEL